MPSVSISARGLRLSLGRTVVLDGAELQLATGWRVGLVGPNGVGKSTLLRAMAGLQPVEGGTVVAVPPEANLGYLPQEPERRPGETVLEFLRRRTGVSAASAELHDATDALAGGDAEAGDRYASALDRWMSLGGADLDGRVGPLWSSLGLADHLLDDDTALLSGGEAARVSLAGLLLARFDAYLLDEPTNDLDLDGLARLEGWVLGQSAPMAIVSHDREFLRRTVTHVAELDEFTHRITVFSGGWEAYLAEREVAARHARQRFDVYAEKKSTVLGRAQREREWASQGLSRAKKRPDDNDKNIKRFKIDQTEQLAARAARTERAFERLEVVDEPRRPWQLRLTFGEAGRSGDVVVRLHEATVVNGEFVLGPLDLTIGAGERVAIVGANGSGKSTLLDAILGRRPLTAGDRWFGPGVVVGELEQQRLQLDGVTVLDAFVGSTGMLVTEARTLLAKFGIGAAEVGRPTRSLSPGERTRTVLALLMAAGTNCLVLDEPTNHLDVPAIEQLEQALDVFAGAVLLVTHDRQMLQAVRLTRTVRLDHGRIVADDPV